MLTEVTVVTPFLLCAGGGEKEQSHKITLSFLKINIYAADNFDKFLSNKKLFDKDNLN